MRQATTQPPGTMPCLGPGLFQMRKHRPPEGCVQNQGSKHKCHCNHGRPQIGQIRGCARVAIHSCKRCHGQSTQNQLQVQPHQQTFTHMEFHNRQPSRTRPAKYPTVVLSAKIDKTVYSKVNAQGSINKDGGEAQRHARHGSHDIHHGKANAQQLKMSLIIVQRGLSLL